MIITCDFFPECLAFLRDLKDKKLTSDQKERKNKMVAALDGLLKGQQQGAANGHAGADAAEEGDLYLPMDEESLLPSPKESAGKGTEPLQQESYEPMSEGQLKGDVPPATEGSDSEYMNPYGDRPPEEEEQEEYEDVESALDASKNFLAAGQTDLAHARSPAISPSPSADNIADKGRKKRSSLPFGRGKKRGSESDSVCMPDPSTAQLSGTLEYRSGRVGRFSKQWIVLEGGCLFIGKSEEDQEAVRMVSACMQTLEVKV